MKPLSEQELREKIRKIATKIYRYGGQVADDVDELANLILQDRKAYGEQRELQVWQAVRLCVENTDSNTQRLLRFKLPDFDKRISELQRQRNQGEKTDE